ncbi:MAG: SRPBCC family protein [Myxococcota bacterium]
MTNSSTDRIEKEIQLAAPVERVWRALTDAAQFGQWFQVALEGSFRVGETVRGTMTHPDAAGMTFVAHVERMEPHRAFTFRWNQTEPDPHAAPGSEPTTTVEFVLKPRSGGTWLRMIESGFDALPPELRTELWARTERGWREQMQNIARHVQG